MRPTGVWRGWILPIARLVVFAVIAVALVKVAFFPSSDAGDDVAQPTGGLTDPVYVVALGDLDSRIEIDGTVAADAATEVRANATGTVNKVFAAEGAVVRTGDPIIDIRVETTVEVPAPSPSTSADGTEQVQAAPTTRTSVKYETVVAPVDGTVRGLTTDVRRAITDQDVFATVSPGTYSVSGTIAPTDRYRLLAPPAEAQVTIPDGPAPFACTDLRIQDDVTGASSGTDPQTGAPTTGSTTSSTITCRVPGDVRVFGGLTATIAIAEGAASGVLVVPTTAVEGGAGSGTVYRVASEGAEPEPVVVETGLNDGTSVQIVSGLVEGDLILQFTPSAEAVVPPECLDEFGNDICGGGVSFGVGG